MWFHIDGRLGAKMKEGVCKGIVKHLADEAREPGGYTLHRMKGGSGRRRALETMRAEAPNLDVAERNC